MLFFKIFPVLRVKDLLIIVLSCVVCQKSLAQPNSRIDSLKNELKTSVEDTNKVNVLNDLSRIYRQRAQYEDAKKFANEAVTLARKLNFKRGLALAHFNLGEVCRGQSNLNEALANYQASLKIREELGEKRGIAACKNAIGLIYDAWGNYIEALKNYQVSLEIRKEMNDKQGMAVCYNSIGEMHNRIGNYPEALNNLLTSLKIQEELKDSRGIALCYSNIGTTYNRQGNQEEALKYHLASLEIREKIGDKLGIAASYTNVGLILDKQGKDAEALKNHLASLEIRNNIGDRKGIAVCYSNIGLLFGKQGKDQEALEKHLTSLAINEEIGEKRAIGFCYNNIGKIYTRLCQYDKAKEYLTKGLLLSKEIGAKDNIRDAYNGLSRLDSAMGNHKQALTYYRLYTNYKDTILNETNSQFLIIQQMVYESEKKDNKILKLESDKQITTLLLKTQQDSLNLAKAEKDKVQLENDKVKLENEKFRALNLYNNQQMDLLKNEKEIQRLRIENDSSEYALQKSESDKKHEQLIKEKAIRELQLKRETQAKNYFIGGLIFFTILSFIIYRYYHTRQKLKLLTLRNKIASDLHDDVGSTLSSISIFSQMAQQQSKETIPMLESIEDSSKKMLDAMADIVWTINPENDHFEKIISRMKNFAYELLGAKSIDFEFIADDQVEKINVPMEVRKNLYLIFKEATNNMVKYAQADKAMFTIKGEKNNLTMMIRDNGKGFDMNKTTEGNGLKNMMRRANEIGGKLLIDSFPGNGTKIQLSVAV